MQADEESYVLAHILQGAKVVGVGGNSDLYNPEELYVDLELDFEDDIGQRIIYRLYVHKAEALNEPVLKDTWVKG